MIFGFEKEKMSSDETKLFWQKVTELFYNCLGKDKTFSKRDEERFYRDFQMLKLQCYSKDEVDVYGDLVEMKDRISLQRDDCNDRQILVEKCILERYIKILVSLSRDRLLMKKKRDFQEEEDITEILEAKRRQRRIFLSYVVVFSSYFGAYTEKPHLPPSIYQAFD